MEVVHVFTVFYVYQYTMLFKSSDNDKTCTQIKFIIYALGKNIYAWSKQHLNLKSDAYRKSQCLISWSTRKLKL